MKLRIAFYYVGATLLLCSCANLSSLQTARTLAPGTKRYILGGGVIKTHDISKVIDVPQSVSNRSDSFTYFEFASRRGLKKPGIDVGAKVTIPGEFSGDVKYQLIDLGPLAFSVGIGMGLLSMGTESEFDQRFNLVDMMVPVYLSFDIGRFFCIYTSAKYIARAYFGMVSGWSHLAAATGGIKIGSTWGIMVEATLAQDLVNPRLQPYQVNTAIFFGTGS